MMLTYSKQYMHCFTKRNERFKTRMTWHMYADDIIGLMRVKWKQFREKEFSFFPDQKKKAIAFSIRYTQSRRASCTRARVPDLFLSHQLSHIGYGQSGIVSSQSPEWNVAPDRSCPRRRSPRARPWRETCSPPCSRSPVSAAPGGGKDPQRDLLVNGDEDDASEEMEEEEEVARGSTRRGTTPDFPQAFTLTEGGAGVISQHGRAVYGGTNFVTRSPFFFFSSVSRGEGEGEEEDREKRQR